MHRTQAYKTCDGELFEDEAAAALHEAELKIGKWTERKGIANDGALTCEAVAKAMIDDAEELAHLFVNLVRSLPKNSASAFIDSLVEMPDAQAPVWQPNGANRQQVTN